MRRHLLMRRAGAALTLPLVLALTSCGDDSDSTKNAETSTSDKAGGDKDSEATDAAATGGDKTTPKSGGDTPAALEADVGDTISSKDFTALMNAAFSTASTAKVEMSSGGKAGMTATGAVDYTTKTPSMQLTMRGGGAGEGQAMDVRLVRNTMYMNTGMSGDKFIKFDLGKSGAGSPIDPTQMDPSRALKQFEKSAKKITYRGEEKIDGDELKRFTLLLDPAKMGDYGAEQVKSLPDEIGYDVWFDDESHFRQLKIDMGELGTTTMKYSDWGKPVSITAPPKEQVIEQPTMPNAPGGA